MEAKPRAKVERADEFPLELRRTLRGSSAKRTEMEALARGASLRDLVGAALERELNRPSVLLARRKRARFPIFDSKVPGSFRLSNAEIAKLQGAEDVRRHGRSH